MKFGRWTMYLYQTNNGYYYDPWKQIDEEIFIVLGYIEVIDKSILIYEEA